MLVAMDYSAHYSRLIEHARNRVVSGYSERHHVVPRCMGGSNDPDNLVRLTTREHFVAHQLLCKIHPGVGKLIFAVMVMCRDAKGRRMNNRLYSWVREKHLAHCNSSEVVSARVVRGKAVYAANPDRYKRMVAAAHTPEAVSKVAAARRRLAQTPEFKASERAAALKRWETRDKAPLREMFLKMHATRNGPTKGSSLGVVEVLPNGFVVNEYPTIKAAALAKGIAHSYLHNKLRNDHHSLFNAGCKMMEIIPK